MTLARRLGRLLRGFANLYIVVAGLIFGTGLPLLALAQINGLPIPSQFQIFVLGLNQAGALSGNEGTPVVVGTGAAATTKLASVAQIAQLGGGGGGSGGCTSIPCPVAQGGTGDITLTQHGLMVGEGASPVNSLAPGNAGAVPISQGGALDPIMTVISGDGTLASNGVLTVTKSNGQIFGTAAFLNAGTSGPALCQVNLNCNFSGTPIFSSGAFPLHGLLLTEGGSPLAAVAPGAAGTVLLGQGASLDPLMVALSGDCTVSSIGVIVCTKTNGTAFGTAATHNIATSGANVPLLNTTNVWGAGQSVQPVALTDGITIAIDFSQGNVFTLTLGGNRTLANPSNAPGGQCGQIFITQDATGSRTLAYQSNWKFSGGAAPTLTTTAGATDVLSYCTASPTFVSAQLLPNVK